MDDRATIRHSLADDKTCQRLKASWKYLRKLPLDTAVEFEVMPAQSLLVPQRFDIAIKCVYGRLWMNNQCRDWRTAAYYEHVLRITGPGAAIREWDGSGKSGLDGFLSSFHELLQELDPNSIPPVPIDRNCKAFDGAHRIAAAIVRNRSVLVARIDAEAPGLPNAAFFQGTRHGHSPCPQSIMDEAAIEYCKHKNKVTLAIIYPSIVSHQHAVEALSDVANIVYKKQVRVCPEAGASLLTQAYLGHPWADVGTESEGFADKLKQCFPCRGVLTVVMLDEVDHAQLARVKGEIRDYYGIGNHSIHTTDSYEEALRLARTLFNETSIEVIQRGTSRDKNIHDRLSLLREWMEREKIDPNDLCIDGGTLLATLGIRATRDLDFLYGGDSVNLRNLPEKLDCHNESAIHHSLPIEELLGNPDLHFWYMGIKFCTPKVVREMKMNRGEEKDFDDARELALWMDREYRRRFGLFLAELERSYIRARRLAGRVLRRSRRMVNTVWDKVRRITVRMGRS